MFVKDIMTVNYPAFYEDELVTKARAVIRERGLRILPVIDKQKRLLGIVSRSDIMAISSSKSPIRVKGIMSTLAYVATVDMEASKAIREMIRRDTWYATVIDSVRNRLYKGVLGLDNFIDALMKKKSPKFKKPVYEVMTTDIVTFSPEDGIDNVWRLMREKSLSGLPVVNEGKLVGIVTEKDLLERSAIFPAFESNKGRFKSSTKISSIMKTSVVALKEAASLKEAARLMLDKNFGRLPIVDEKGTLLGIIDREDVVRALL